MNRDRQMKKDRENKQLQAREEYAKNKPLYVENKIQEKAEGQTHDTIPTPEGEDENRNDADKNKDK